MSHKANLIRAKAFGRELGHNPLIVKATVGTIQEIFHSFSLALTRGQAQQRELTTVQRVAFQTTVRAEAIIKTDLPAYNWA